MPHAPKSKRSPVMQFLVTFAIVYLVTTLGMRVLFPDRFGGEEAKKRELPPIAITSTKRSAPINRSFSVKIENNLEREISFPSRCPAPPFTIAEIIGDGEEIGPPLEITKLTGACPDPITIPPQDSVLFDMGPWKYEAFSEKGVYLISIPETDIQDLGFTGSVIEASKLNAIIKIKDPNFLVSVFRVFISKPIMNGLVLIASILPGHSLGWSIIILTVVIKFLLFFPTQHALEGQRKLQQVQPKLNALKKKYGKDQKKLTEETMKLWKQEKINPLQSCLPTLLQIPVLLGLFFIIRDSSNLEYAQHLLYKPFQDVAWSFSHLFLNFLNLNTIPFDGVSLSLTGENIRRLLLGIPIPLIISSLQFGQMKLSFAHSAKKKKDKEGDKAKGKDNVDTAQMQQKMMMYMLPLMLLFFSGTFPIAVSLYWGTSTLFGIGQQFYVNRKVT